MDITGLSLDPGGLIELAERLGKDVLMPLHHERILFTVCDKPTDSLELVFFFTRNSATQIGFSEGRVLDRSKKQHKKLCFFLDEMVTPLEFEAYQALIEIDPTMDERIGYDPIMDILEEHLMLLVRFNMPMMGCTDWEGPYMYDSEIIWDVTTKIFRQYFENNKATVVNLLQLFSKE